MAKTSTVAAISVVLGGVLLGCGLPRGHCPSGTDLGAMSNQVVVQRKTVAAEIRTNTYSGMYTCTDGLVGMDCSPSAGGFTMPSISMIGSTALQFVSGTWVPDRVVWVFWPDGTMAGYSSNNIDNPPRFTVTTTGSPQPNVRRVMKITGTICVVGDDGMPATIQFNQLEVQGPPGL